jgi:hypothetical protein
MPRKASGNDVPVTIKMPRAWVDLADRLVEVAIEAADAARDMRAAARPTRTDLFRFALWDGLERLSKDFEKQLSGGQRKARKSKRASQLAASRRKAFPAD